MKLHSIPLGFVLLALLVLGSSSSSHITPISHIALASSKAFDCSSTQSCAQEGDECKDTFDPKKEYADASNCAIGLTCHNNTCISNNFGSECKGTEDCVALPTTAYYGCVNNICTELYGPGDQCQESTDCVGALNCQNNVCQGLNQGEACDIKAGNNGLCEFGLQCLTTCEPTIAQGEPCTNDASCYPGTTCVKGTCVAQYSLGLGASCDATACKSGLTCATTNSTCITAVTYQTCKDAATDCTEGATCTCSTFSGKGYCEGGLDNVNYCDDENRVYSRCLNNNKCTSETDAPSSCSYINCYPSFKKYQACLCSLEQDIAGDCFWNPYCNDFPLWAIVMFTAIGFILVLVCVIAIFCMIKKKDRSYEAL
eukprot:TRINITY_DN58_c0_g2_i1.p1 TRINITY_DN58_c0_g2~~TRINITY_DN58_c0_g2_i1.p1  ORF type:complete len:369 (-),score=53.87 TRINITY_DN58_c0_g2_i1:72-1178(-)